MSDEQTYQIQRLNAALEVSGRTIKSMESKLAVMQDLVVRMEHDKKNMQQARIGSEEIIRKQLEFADQEKAKLQDEIMELRRQIKELKSA
jgi:hypothetical protein